MNTIRLAISDVLGREAMVPVSKQCGDWAVHYHYDGMDAEGKVLLKDGKEGRSRCYQVTHAPTGFLVRGFIEKRKDAYQLAAMLAPIHFTTTEIPTDLIPKIVATLNEWTNMQYVKEDAYTTAARAALNRGAMYR